MVYLLYGNENTMIKNRIKKIRKELFNGEEENIVNFDLDKDSIGNLIDEMNQMFIYGSAKLIIADNANFFVSDIKSRKNDQIFSELLSAIENLDENTHLIFVVHGSKISLKNTIYSKILKDGKVLEFKDIQKSDWPIYAGQFFKKRNISISQDALNELIKRANNDLSVFNNEASKLILYKINNIELADVEALVPQNLEDDVFKIMNSLNNGEKKEALKVYYDLRVKNIEPVTLINLFSSSILFMLNVKNLLLNNYKVDEIAKITGSSAGRIYITQKNVKNYKPEFFIDKLTKLAELDKDIKHSRIDRFVGFERFLIEY